MLRSEAIRQFRLAALLLYVLILTASLSAQNVQGDLTGTVRDPSGLPIPRVQVTIVNETNGATRVLITDENGDYRAIGFFLGSYRVDFEKVGFKKKAVRGVKVESATLRRVDAEL